MKMSKIFPSELEKEIPSQPPPIEKSRNQLFKTPALATRDILEKMQKNQIGKKTTTVFGRPIEKAQLWVLTGLMVLFLVGFFGVVTMWLTNLFDNAIFANLALQEGSHSFEMWRKPSPKPLVRIYVFNYTNVAEYEAGDAEKLNVQELGPYVYEVSLERLNIKFHDDSVSYQEERRYKFMPDLSKGRRQNDKLIVPNVPLFSAAAVYKHSNFLTRFGVSKILNSLNAKPFITIPADKFITGYEDDLYKVSKSMLKLQNERPYDKFGLVASNIGIHEDVFEINTGSKDINKIAQIKRFNGAPSLPHWSTDECNSLEEATDGSMFSPKKIRNKHPVYLYAKEMCRSLPLYFEKEVAILNNKIPAYRYTLPYSVFDSPDKLPSNQCFCNLDLGECPPQGVFNATPCAFGAPAFLSFPHFYNGDPALLEGVTGLKPEVGVHRTYADIHPTLGFVMAGKTRMQLNIQVVKSFGMSQLNNFEDNLMLPVSWFEFSLEDKTLPEDMVGIIFQTTFTLKSVEMGLKYGCLLTAVITLLSILLVVKNNWPRRSSSLQSV